MVSLKNKKDRLSNSPIFKFFGKLLTKQILLGILVTVLLFLTVVSNVTPEKMEINVDDFAEQDIVATKDIVDEYTTKILKEEAMQKVLPRYKVDQTIQIKIKNDIRDIFGVINDIKADENIKLNTKYEVAKQQLSIALSEGDIIAAINNSPEKLKMLESNIYDILGQIMATGITEEEVKYEKENIKDTFDKLDNLSKPLQKLGISIISNTIEPNRFLDNETTQQKKQEAASKIENIVIKKGQMIVRKGDEIDTRTINLIRKTGLLKEGEGPEYGIILGSFLIVFILEILMVVYLYVFNKEILNNIKLLSILTIIILSVVLISITLYDISGYFIPIAAATMLISILLDARLALLADLIIVIITGLITGNDVNIMVMSLVGGTVGAIGIVKNQQRHNIFITGLIVGAVNVFIILVLGLINNVDLQQLAVRSIYGLLNGVFASILTIGSLPLWESGFGIVTPLKLLELSNPNSPLLKRLLLEASGTYHHSILVGNLSETAVEAIGGNALLARVGAYYHDVGKLKRPYFFKENQMNGENPHDKINPNLSTLIITNHIKDGVEMAQKYKIPSVIIDIIEQHHGNTLVAYFYHKAITGENSENVKEENFRYAGPKPKTKEAAIIMLADSVEAAVRSIQEPTKGKIEGLVREIIKSKLEDGQLTECDLTFKDLDIVASSFLNVLLGIFHERIEYPKLDLDELKGGN